MSAAHVVVVEDEPSIALPLVDRLTREGHRVTHAQDGGAGLAAARQGDVDLVVLDLMLPVRSGSDVLASLRAAGNAVPVIVLTARAAADDRVSHLRAGADDYVTKPFSLDELCARVDAVLRRASPAVPPASVRVGDAVIDLDGHTVRRGDVVEALSPIEAAILALLLERRGRTTTRRDLLDRVWGRYTDVGTRTVDFHVKNLRRKLEVEPDRPRVLLTDHGVGYRLEG